jgi:pimeloyl-ACP methyl ester carboxylesterase
MRHKVNLVAISLLGALRVYSQDIAGDWQGTLKAGPAELRLLVHITKTESGGWKGALDSIDQGAAGIAIPSITLKDSKISFAVPSIQGLYDGKLNAAGTAIEGVWSQGQPMPLNLTRTTPAPRSDIDGAWLGQLHAGAMPLRLVFHIASTAKGLTANMDSLDQGAKGIPASAVTRTGSNLSIEFKQIGGKFEGSIYRNPASIAGTWTQGGSNFSLVLTPVNNETALERRRPQNPVKPYPYREEEVSYRNEKAGITLGGTMTIPPGKGPFPGVVLITGSGQQDRDETLMGHKPFLVLADHLTRKGIAVLRSDDRGMGKSGGNFAKSTTADFADDAEAAFAYLQTRHEINARKIGFIGHSEGGVIAPMIAARNPQVTFIVMMAGTGVRGDELLPIQVMRLVEASGASHEAAEEAAATQREVLKMVIEGKDDATIKQRIGDLSPGGMTSEMQLQALRSPWFRYFLAYDPAEALRKVKCPVLALDGDKDLQVDSKQNLPAIRKALEAGGNKKFELVELPGLNHLLQTANTGAVGEYAEIEETIAPMALDKMSSWILKQ